MATDTYIETKVAADIAFDVAQAEFIAVKLEYDTAYDDALSVYEQTTNEAITAAQKIYDDATYKADAIREAAFEKFRAAVEVHQKALTEAEKLRCQSKLSLDNDHRVW